MGYLKDEAATEAAWRGGWFHTGDVVWRGPDGMLHFVDRKKNIIRRSGENIAAAEVEALLLTHPDVHQVAVMAVKDELREEEVLACVVLRSSKPGKETAEALFQYCLRADRLLQGARLDPFRARHPDDGHAEDPEAQHLSEGHRSALGCRDVRHAQPEAASEELNGTLSRVPFAPIVERAHHRPQRLSLGREDILCARRMFLVETPFDDAMLFQSF